MFKCHYHYYSDSRHKNQTVSPPYCRYNWDLYAGMTTSLYKIGLPKFDGILPKGPHTPCLRMADRAHLAEYPGIHLYKRLGRSFMTDVYCPSAFSYWLQTERVFQMSCLRHLYSGNTGRHFVSLMYYTVLLSSLTKYVMAFNALLTVFLWCFANKCWIWNVSLT